MKMRKMHMGKVRMRKCSKVRRVFASAAAVLFLAAQVPLGVLADTDAAGETAEVTESAGMAEGLAQSGIVEEEGYQNQETVEAAEGEQTAEGGKAAKEDGEQTVEGGEAAKEEDGEIAEEEGNETDIAVQADEAVQSGYVDGTNNAVSWTYDAETKTTVVTGVGTRVGGNSDSCFPAETEHIKFENCEMGGSYDRLFSGLSGLLSIDFTGLRMVNATSMGYMFYECSGLTSLDLGSFDTSQVTYMSNMFYKCSGLTSLDLGSFDMSQVMYMEHMLYGCSGLTSLNTPCNVMTVAALPVVSGTFWSLPDGTEVIELPLNMDSSVLITRHNTTSSPTITTTTPDLNMEDVIRVKYVPYSYTVKTNNEDEENKVTFSIVEGSLAEGLQMYPATGEIYGIPMEAGEFKIKVMAVYSNPEFQPSYAELTLIVIENTDENVEVASDSGYEIIQPVPNLNPDALAGVGGQILISEGEYSEFLDVYLDGIKLIKETEYTSEAGSTRITILNQTLSRAGTGSHTIGIEFRTQSDNTLKRAAQNFTIADTGDSKPGDDGGDVDKPGEGDSDADKPGEGGSDTDKPGNDSDTDNGGGSGDGEHGTDADSDDEEDNDEKDLGAEEAQIIIYTVMAGDNLWKISAKFYGTGAFWNKIYEENAVVISSPDRIAVGQKIRIPLTGINRSAADSGNVGKPTAEGMNHEDNSEKRIYRVVLGDSLWDISKKVYGSGWFWEKIYQANRNVISVPSRLYVGQELVIPEH